MNIIKVENLSNSGLDLFQDSETFLNDLTENELNCVKGGFLNLATIGRLLLFFNKGYLNQLAIHGEKNAKTINGQTFNAYTNNNINTY